MCSMNYPVKIYCPVIDAEETVYFHPVKNGEKYTVAKMQHLNFCKKHKAANSRIFPVHIPRQI